MDAYLAEHGNEALKQKSLDSKKGITGGARKLLRNITVAFEKRFHKDGGKAASLKRATQRRARHNATIRKKIESRATRGVGTFRKSNSQRKREQMATFLARNTQTRPARDIKKAYFDMSRRGKYRHPDKGGDKASFQKLNNIYMEYEEVATPEKKKYDEVFKKTNTALKNVVSKLNTSYRIRKKEQTSVKDAAKQLTKTKKAVTQCDEMIKKCQNLCEVKPGYTKGQKRDCKNNCKSKIVKKGCN